MIEIGVYKSDGSLSQKETREHNNKGNIMETNIYNSDGSLYLKITYKYDDKGNRTEENIYDPEDNTNRKVAYKYQYDSHGNWTQRTGYQNDRVREITEREIEYY